MVRGLCSNWKQVLFFNFDETMRGDLLLKLIIFAEEAGIEISAVVFDLGNKCILGELGVDIERPSFPNPFDPQRSVYVIPDPIHMVKLFRNHLLDDGVTLGKCYSLGAMHRDCNIRREKMTYILWD